MSTCQICQFVWIQVDSFIDLKKAVKSNSTAYFLAEILPIHLKPSQFWQYLEVLRRNVVGLLEARQNTARTESRHSDGGDTEREH